MSEGWIYAHTQIVSNQMNCNAAYGEYVKLKILTIFFIFFTIVVVLEYPSNIKPLIYLE